MSEIEKVKRRLKRKFTRMLAECEQTVRDCQYWAQYRAECPPLDAEWFIVQAAGLRKCLTALERNERIEDSWLQKS